MFLVNISVIYATFKNKFQTFNTLFQFWYDHLELGSYPLLKQKKDEEMVQLKENKAIMDNIKTSKVDDIKNIDAVTGNCSKRVLKHLKIIIDNKMNQDDLRSSLKLVLLRMDDGLIWEEIIGLVKRIDSPQIVANIIEELRGCPRSDAIEEVNASDSAPEETESDEEDSPTESKLEPRKIDFDDTNIKSPEKKGIKKPVLDTSMKKKVVKKLENAKNLKRKRIVEVLEEQAKIAMEDGDQSLNQGYNEIVSKLTGGPETDGQPSPIIRTKKAPKIKKTKKLKINVHKTFSMDDLTIMVEDDSLYSMKDLILEAEDDGSGILDKNTVELTKKMPCGFYPCCLNDIGKEQEVFGGVLVKPKGHRRAEKFTYFCKTHAADPMDTNKADTADAEGGKASRIDTNKGGNEEVIEDSEEEMTDLETSVMEEEKLNTIETLANAEENEEDESFLSQSLLAKKK